MHQKLNNMFSVDWFSHNIPTLEIVMNRYKGHEKPLVFVEIGSYEGRSTLWLLENVLTGQNDKILCIDPFTGSMEHENVPHNLIDIFHENTKQHKEKIIAIQDTSQNAMAYIKSDWADCIYIDGSHKAKDVLDDAINAYRVAKQGGIIVFDDYMWDVYSAPQFIPKTGIDAFLSVYGDNVKILHTGYQLIVEKL